MRLNKINSTALFNWLLSQALHKGNNNVITNKHSQSWLRPRMTGLYYFRWLLARHFAAINQLIHSSASWAHMPSLGLVDHDLQNSRRRPLTAFHCLQLCLISFCCSFYANQRLRIMSYRGNKVISQVALTAVLVYSANRPSPSANKNFFIDLQVSQETEFISLIKSKYLNQHLNWLWFAQLPVCSENR